MVANIDWIVRKTFGTFIAKFVHCDEKLNLSSISDKFQKSMVVYNTVK